MAKSKRRHAPKANVSSRNIRNTTTNENSNNNNESNSSPFQPLNMFFGGPRAAGYASIPQVSREGNRGR